MKVLIACERSGIVRQAFRERGHDAWSCDLLPAEDRSPYHIVADARDIAYAGGWDMMIAHPPCQRLSRVGICWLYQRNLWSALDEALAFFWTLWEAPIPRICIENPTPHRHAAMRLPRPSQVIQPSWFGERHTKRTLLWLRGLPPLMTTCIVANPSSVIGRIGGKDRSFRRAITPAGVARAMAKQWG